MRSKNIIVLLIVAVILSVIFFVVKTTTDITISNDQSVVSLFPDVDIEEIVHILITKGKESVNIKKKDLNWIVEEKGGYYADFSKVRKLVVQITSLRSSQKATKNKAHYKRLKVDIPSDENLDSVMVNFKKGDGSDIAQLILGEKRKTKEGSSPYMSAAGQYVRIPSSEQVFIITENISLDTKPGNWIKKEILNIEKDEVKRVNIKGPKKIEEVLAQREKKEDVLTLEKIQADKKIIESEVKRLAEILGNFSIIDALPVDAEEVKNLIFNQTFLVSLFNGLNYKLSLSKKNNKYYSKLSVEYLQPKKQVELKESTEELSADDKKAEESKASKEVSEKSPEELIELARAANEEYRHWIYVINSNKYEQMTKKKLDFFEKKDKK